MQTPLQVKGYFGFSRLPLVADSNTTGHGHRPRGSLAVGRLPRVLPRKDDLQGAQATQESVRFFAFFPLGFARFLGGYERAIF